MTTVLQEDAFHMLADTSELSYILGQQRALHDFQQVYLSDLPGVSVLFGKFNLTTLAFLFL